MTKRILVTGSRDWDDTRAIEEALQVEYLRAALEGEKDVVLVSGACPTGADALAEQIWFMNTGLNPECHPADWTHNGKQAGFLRNQHMVDLGADICLAFIKNASLGATDCARRASEAGIHVRRWEVTA